MSSLAADQIKKPPEQGSGLVRLVLQISLLGLLFLVVVWASFLFIQRPEGITWIWLPSGVALALLITNRQRIWPFLVLAIVIADVLANLLAGRSWIAGLVFGLATGLGAFAAASLLKRFCAPLPDDQSARPANQPAQSAEFTLTFRRFGNVLAFLGTIVVVHVFTALVSVSMVPRPGGFGSAFLTWWVSTVLGSALVVPLVAAWRELRPNWAGAGWAGLRPGRLVEGLALSIFLALSAWLLFLSRLPDLAESVLPAYLIFPFLIWAAVRFDQRYVTTAMAVICLAAVIGGQNDLGIFTDPLTANQLNIHSMQLYLLMLIVTTLNLNAVLAELKMTTSAVSVSAAEHRALIQNATIGIFHSMPWGGYLDANPSLASMLGYASPEELISRVQNIPEQLYVDAKDYDRIVEATLDQAGWNHSVTRYRRKDGSQMIGRLSVRKVLSMNGSQAYLEGFVEDITERLRVEDALRTNEQVMKLFVENAPAAIAMFDREMRYMVTSRRYRQDYDLGEQVLTGRAYAELFPASSARWQELYRRCLAGEVEKCEEEPLIHADGRQDLVRWELRPWYQAGREIGGVILLSEVITERKASEQALKKSETLLNETQAIARVGGWEYDLASSRMTWTQEVFRIYAVAPDFDTNDLQRNFRFYSQEDRPSIQQAFNKAIQTGEPFDLELRFVDANRRHLWVRTRGTAVVENERVVRVTGTIMDISERKRAEGALVRSEEQLRLAMEASNDGMWDWRPQKNMQYYSPAYYRMLNYTEDEFPGDLLAWMEFIHPDDQTIVRRTIEACRADLLPSFEIEFRLKAKQGGWKWILSRGKTVSRDAAGRPVRVVGTTVDITERKLVEEALRRANRKLERQAEANDRMQILLIEQATHDALTGLYNRRFLDDALQREILRANREGYPVSILMLDIDHFKMFNDSYGHEAGDQVLVALSSLLRVNIRQSDIACRYGGEEFVVIMPKASGVDARHRAERICEDFGNIRIGLGSLSATISVGLAVYPQHGVNIDELLRAADSALYLAKGAGRNCVRIWTS